MEQGDSLVYEKEKPILYTAAGEPAVVKKPLGFARHPACTAPVKGVASTPNEKD